MMTHELACIRTGVFAVENFVSELSVNAKAELNLEIRKQTAADAQAFFAELDEIYSITKKVATGIREDEKLTELQAASLMLELMQVTELKQENAKLRERVQQKKAAVVIFAADTAVERQKYADILVDVVDELEGLKVEVASLSSGMDASDQNSITATKLTKETENLQVKLEGSQEVVQNARAHSRIQTANEIALLGLRDIISELVKITSSAKKASWSVLDERILVELKMAALDDEMSKRGLEYIELSESAERDRACAAYLAALLSDTRWVCASVGKKLTNELYELMAEVETVNVAVFTAESSFVSTFEEMEQRIAELRNVLDMAKGKAEESRRAEAGQHKNQAEKERLLEFARSELVRFISFAPLILCWYNMAYTAFRVCE
jgi:hypothetical protein